MIQIQGKRLSVFLLMLVAIVTCLNVVSQAQTVMTRHVREAVLNGQATATGRLPATRTLRFDIVLPLRHQPELENFLADIYDPSSSNYRHFVTPEEFTARFGPSQEDYDALVRFAQSNGFKVVGGSRDGMDLQLTGTVASIEKALHVTMNLYQHPTEKRTFFAPDREPTLGLSFAVWHITGLDNYSKPRPLYVHKDPKLHSNVVKGSCPGGYYCGSDMRAAYLSSSSPTGTGQNIALFELAGTDLDDLSTYYSTVGQTQPYTPKLISSGGYGTACLASNDCDDAEQTLDMTQAMGIAPGSKMLYMYVCGDAYGDGTFSDTACLSSMSTTAAAPLSPQISCSWAWTPADPSSDDPFYEKFAAQGQNFFVASGDGGSYPSSSRPFYYPAEDSLVTAVGGTDLQVSSKGGPWSSETGWIHSGGGISPDSIPIPAWQQLPGVVTSQNHGSKTLRNVPDVAGEANFDFFVCADQSGCAGGWGGTSFAAPMWAGILALVNQQAIANGDPVLGFINPAVYNIGLGSGYSTAFHDITTGGNGGFQPVTGYDLVTGWGSPNTGLIAALAGGGGGGGGTITVSPTSLTWGSVVIGATGAKKPVTITNTGTTTVTFSSITTSGDFGQTTSPKPCGSSLAAGKSCKVEVTFTPTAAGARTGTLTITDNASGSPQTVALSGTGAVQAKLTPATKTFPAEKVGVASPAKVFTLTNEQSVSLTGISVSTTGDFSVSSTTCSASLGAKAKCTISVVFKPTATGTRTGTLKVADSAVGSPQTSSLTGTGK